MDHHEIAGIDIKLTPVPVAPVKAKESSLKSAFVTKAKIRIESSCFFLVYKLPKAQLIVAINEREFQI
jgi:hypothetical protein